MGLELNMSDPYSALNQASYFFQAARGTRAKCFLVSIHVETNPDVNLMCIYYFLERKASIIIIAVRIWLTKIHDKSPH